MVKRMLIDATHPEETRVVVVNGTRLEELDVETSTKKQLKGNIYLAKVVRVEPSLQAAFVDYGGNRHGFLAFSEIHPDYFQIPVADRQALLAAQKAAVSDSNGDSDHDAPAETAEGAETPAEGEAQAAEGENGEGGEGGPEQVAKPTSVESVGGDDPSDQELERRRARLLRNYKIQEVIKRRQIMLVQVVKEERGNKGAALTTYLSLAGRYCVLMPNTARGGGVSRKIVSTTDRRRLKAIAQELNCPEGMAVIVRTAGSERSKTEIKRDYEYLLRAWDNVRDLTLKSSAPALVYEEASLIKRSIRDLYSRDIDEVLVDGDEGYRLAKDYMRMLTPSHAKKVQPYKDPLMPMFHRYQVETQLDAMHSPIVQLRSGGYIVINQTEALVAIDVNSGRATKERHIEETALKTNLEAAEEVARQLRLRDLAGLIVIDFIDMEESRNNHAVERKLKEALKDDRARIQVGKISAFGLLELSRQRLRPSLQETTFSPCPHCAGTGLVRSVESAAMHVLRAIEEEGIRRRSAEVTVYVPSQIALYILNQKRDALAAIEERYDFRVFLAGDDSLIPPNLRMERIKAENRPEEIRPAITLDVPPLTVVEDEDEAEEEEDVAEEAEGENERAQAENGTDGDNGEGRKRRRRRRRKRRPGEAPSQLDLAAGEGEETEGEAEDGEETEAEEAEGEDANGEGEGELDADGERRKRRRGRRGGRRRRRNRENGEGGDEQAEGAEDGDDEGEGEGETKPVAAKPLPAVPGGDLIANPDAVADVFAQAEAAAEAEAARKEAQAAPAEEAATEDKPRRRRAPRKAAEAAPAEPVPDAAAPTEAEAVAEEKPKRSRAKKAAPADKAEPKTKEKAEPKPRSRAKKAETAEATPAEGEAKPKRSRAKKVAPAEAETPVVSEAVVEAMAEVAAEVVAEAPAAAPVETAAPAAPAPAQEEDAPAPARPARKGWWNKLL